MSHTISCRPGCGACCIAISIQTPLPLHPQGKAAGQHCRHLDQAIRCRLWGTANYPHVCQSFPPMLEHCGNNAEQALNLLTQWEQMTQP